MASEPAPADVRPLHRGKRFGAPSAPARAVDVRRLGSGAHRLMLIALLPSHRSSYRDAATNANEPLVPSPEEPAPPSSRSIPNATTPRRSVYVHRLAASRPHGQRHWQLLPCQPRP